MPNELPERAELLAAINAEQRKQIIHTLLYHEGLAARLGLNDADLKALDLARDIDPLTPGKLAELTGLTTGAITGLLDRLEKAGFVRRLRDAKDRRSITVQWVPARRQEIDQLFDDLSRSINALSTRYSDQELAMILGYMIQNTLAIQQEVARLRRETLAQNQAQHPL